MSGSPPTIKQVSQQELDRIFDDEQWEQRLKACEHFEIYNKPSAPETGLPIDTFTIGYKYFENGRMVAVVFEYKRSSDGTNPYVPRSGKRSPKRLLIGRGHALAFATSQPPSN